MGYERIWGPIWTIELEAIHDLVPASQWARLEVAYGDLKRRWSSAMRARDGKGDEWMLLQREEADAWTGIMRASPFSSSAVLSRPFPDAALCSAQTCTTFVVATSRALGGHDGTLLRRTCSQLRFRYTVVPQCHFRPRKRHSTLVSFDQ